MRHRDIFVEIIKRVFPNTKSTSVKRERQKPVRRQGGQFVSSLLSVLIFVCECNKSIDDRSVMAVNYARRETDILIFNDTITRHHKTSHSSSLCSPQQHLSQAGLTQLQMSTRARRRCGVVGDCLY